MKRCPECRRDYYDDTLGFCLEDGTPLVYGMSADQMAVDEPATAIIHTTDVSGDTQTRSQIHMTDQTAVLPTGIGRTEIEPRGKNIKLGLLVGLAILIAAASLVGYRYFDYDAGSSGKQINSIAVMPFVNESGDADVEYLSDGMTETLISSLSQLPGVSVKPRSSVFRYKGKETSPQTIGTELNVQAILNGRVVQRGNDLTLYVELIDAQKDTVLWKGDYNRSMTNVVALQSEIARDVSAKLKTKLSGADEAKVTKTSTADPEAYQAYLKGRFYWNRRTTENIKKAIVQFKAATDRDPNYALAYVGLADCYAVLGEYAGTPTAESAPQAKIYADRAIALDDRLAEPHATLGIVHDQLWQWADAEREYKRAIELNPNYATAYHWYSIYLKGKGRNDEAAVAIRKAREIDPLSSVIGVNITRLYQLQNNHDAAIENTLKMIELDPGFSASYEFLGLSYLKQGRNAEALASIEKGVESSNRASVALCNLGYAYGITGKRPEAVAIIKELEEKYARKEANGRHIAGVYAGLGENDKAFEWLEKDFRSRNGELINIRWAIPYDSVRDDPRYKDLLKRMNLPE